MSASKRNDDLRTHNPYMQPAITNLTLEEAKKILKIQPKKRTTTSRRYSSKISCLWVND